MINLASLIVKIASAANLVSSKKIDDHTKREDC